MIRTIVLVLLLCSCGVSWAQGDVWRGIAIVPEKNNTPQSGKFWAIIIGINQYQHWIPLKSAVKDAQAVKEVLLDRYGFSEKRITTLIDEQATAHNIYRAFLDMKNKIGKQDSLFIYYAGHGKVNEFEYGSWILVDAQRDKEGTYFDTQKVNALIAKINARHIFLVADACYSGSLFVQRAAKMTDVMTDYYFQHNSKMKSRQALTSGGMEPVLDSGYQGHSIFAYYFLKRLKENREPFLPASWLSAQVEKLVARNAKQRPRWSHLQNTGDEDGEFFFVLNDPQYQPVLSNKVKPSTALGFIEVSAKATASRHLLKNRSLAENTALETAHGLALRKLVRMRNTDIQLTGDTTRLRSSGNIRGVEMVSEKIDWRGSAPWAQVVLRARLNETMDSRQEAVVIDARGKDIQTEEAIQYLVSYANNATARVILQLPQPPLYVSSVQQALTRVGKQSLMVKAVNPSAIKDYIEISRRDMQLLRKIFQHSQIIVVR